MRGQRRFFTLNATPENAPRPRFWQRLGLVLAILCISLPANTFADEALTIGVFPRRTSDATLKMFSPLANYLGQKLNRKVVLNSAPDFNSFWENVANQEYDLVHYNQYHYLRSHSMYGYRVIVRNEEFGRSTISGAIVVRKDSGINKLQDLQDKKIVFGGGRMAMISYIVATHLLRQAGLEEGDYLTQFALNPPKACVATFYRQASAAGAGGRILELPSVKKLLDTSEMKLIAVSKPYAHLPWAVSKNVPTDIATRLQAAMASLGDSEKGRAILKRARLTGLVVSSDSDYDPHRETVFQIVGERY